MKSFRFHKNEENRGKKKCTISSGTRVPNFNVNMRLRFESHLDWLNLIKSPRSLHGVDIITTPVRCNRLRLFMRCATERAGSRSILASFHRFQVKWANIIRIRGSIVFCNSDARLRLVNNSFNHPLDKSSTRVDSHDSLCTMACTWTDRRLLRPIDAWRRGAHASMLMYWHICQTWFDPKLGRWYGCTHTYNTPIV
jgi:hypothetical protein